jgi:ABC-type transporter Mla subunit MlaD
MMNKKIVALAMAVVFSFCTAGLGFAAKLKCTVDGVDGDKVTMTCEDAGKLKAGDKVKVPTPKKGAIEGC